jgi:peptide chain release factor subunit 1
MLEDIDLRELSEVSDTKPSFVSVYLNAKVNEPEKFLSRREKECLDALKKEKELRQIFQENMEQIRDFLEHGKRSEKAKSFAIFSSSPLNFFEGYLLTIEVENQLIVDTSPYIRPLALLEEEWESFAIVLLDHSNAKLYLISSAVISDTKRMHKDIMNKHKKGGCSQMRFQRLRKGAIDQFFKEVAEKLESLLEKEKVRRIILAGPGNAKKEIEDYLPEHLKAKVIAIIDEDIDVPEGQLLSDSLHDFFKKEREEENEMVQDLKAEILKDGLVVYGIDETLRAVTEGRAELLLISMGKKAKGWKCEICNLFRSGALETCYNCGKEVFTVDVIEEMVEAAENMGTTLEFIKDNEFLDELGGVAAFLRY